MGSLAKPSQYWIKKQSEGSQSGSKNIVSCNFAFSLCVSLRVSLSIYVSFFSLPTPTRASQAFLAFPSTLPGLTLQQRAGDFIFHASAFIFACFCLGFSCAFRYLCSHLGLRPRALLANGRKERKKRGKKDSGSFFPPPLDHKPWDLEHVSAFRRLQKTSDRCRVVCFERRVDGKACP